MPGVMMIETLVQVAALLLGDLRQAGKGIPLGVGAGGRVAQHEDVVEARDHQPRIDEGPAAVIRLGDLRCQGRGPDPRGPDDQADIEAFVVQLDMLGADIADRR